MHRIILMVLLVAMLAGCANDSAPGPDPESDPQPDTPPMFALPDEVTGMEFVSNPEAGGAAGVWVEGGYAYLSGSDGLRIVDVHDPAAPIVLAREVAETQGSRDVDLVHHPSGRTYAVQAHGGSRVSIIDVTDPKLAQYVGEVTNIGAAHNIAVVPGTTLIYVSHSILARAPPPGQSGKIDIIDIADVASPTVTPFNFPAVAMTAGAPKSVGATTCHDITFNAELKRAYCAGVSETHVWDITDPMAPTIVQVVHSPGNQIHHGVWDARNGTILIIGDEFAGALAGPMCSPVPNPYAALWFWDISNVATPRPLGYYQVPYNSLGNNNAALCTTHFGGVVADRDLFVIGWYTAGTTLVDFTDPMFPFEVASFRPTGSVNTWEARYSNGHVFTGDTARGMDILRLV